MSLLSYKTCGVSLVMLVMWC